MSTAPILTPSFHPATSFGQPVMLPSERSSSALALPTGLDLRRVTLEHARGLDILTRSIEYLLDSRFYITTRQTAAESDAVQILLRLSRQHFHECIEAAAHAQSLRRWISNRLQTNAN
ncbi:hypothetical protein BH10ACI4_BH10ACI4_16470 [soil metagenome]